MKNIEKTKTFLKSFSLDPEEKIFIRALTHSSYTNENNLHHNDNERLEFLGDAVLQLAISEILYSKKENFSEGEMTIIRANIVCAGNLAQKAGSIGLGDVLLLGRGEEASGGRNRDSILSDALEALLGAIYVINGWESIKRVISELFIDDIENLEKNLFKDYKGMLQEICQKDSSKAKPCYTVVNEIGPAHEKSFITNVSLNDEIIGVGKGKSKKESEQAAAKAAIDYLHDLRN